MWAFQYKHGDRPLEGYTIQRAAGRGGFGEVYYAISDSGREVALKVVQGYEQIELRGITQCMNLKSPHLVTIFDVKYNEQGRPFVIMEYVSGPNLRQMLDEHPAGLGQQKAAFFLREIGKGLQYLHDCGIVHRDLKPGNIFFENGYVKIGDYGLSKSISTSQHSGQTITVGTVHYMAPEIGAGKYDRSIDIYAMGAVLYELITGVPPFIGASPTEVLMKHLSAEPDCTGIPEPFCTAIRRAMAKDPANRFQSIQEMVESVFGAEHVQMSLREFSPQELSMVAGKVAAKVLAGGGSGGSGTFSPSSLPGAGREAARPRDRFYGANLNLGRGGAPSVDDSEAPDSDDLASKQAIDGWAELADDSLPLPARLVLAGTCVLAIAVAVALFGNWKKSAIDPMAVAIVVALSAASATMVILLTSKWLAAMLKREPPWVQRLSIAGPAALGANLLSLPIYFTEDGLTARATSTILAIAGSILICDLREWVSPTRVNRINSGPPFAAGLIAFVLCMIFGGSTMIAVGAVAATTLAVQVLAPWGVRRNPDEVERYTIGGLGIRTDARGREIPGSAARLSPTPPIPVQNVPPPLPPLPGTSGKSSRRRKPVYPPVARWLPFVWLGLFVATLAAGITFCVTSANMPEVIRTWTASNGKTFRSYEMSGMAIGFAATGVNLLVASVFALFRALTKKYRGVWPYLVRPGIRLACICTIVTSGIVLANANVNWVGTGVGTLLIVLSGLTFITITFIPTNWFDPGERKSPADTRAEELAVASQEISPRKRMWALLLAVLGWAGVAGLHRFYVGKVGTGIIWLVTWGLFGIGTLIDVIMVACGEFEDSDGHKLRQWTDEPVDGAPPAGETARRRGEDPVKQIVGSISSALSGAGQAGRSAAAAARAAGGGIVSSLAGLFLFAGSLAALGLALDVPGMFDAGRPNPQIKRELVRAFSDIGLVEWDGRITPTLPRVYETDLPTAGTTVQRTEIRTAGPGHPGSTAGGLAPLTGTVDQLASDMQNEFKDLNREIARAIVSSSREVTRGGIHAPQIALELKAMFTAVAAFRDAAQALEEARNTLARLERARGHSTDGLAVEAPAVPAAPRPDGLTNFPADIRAQVDAARQAARGVTADGLPSIAAPLRLIGLLGCGTLMLLGTMLLILARRSHGGPHLLRGVCGVVCILGAMACLHGAVGGSNFWQSTALLPAQDLAGRALRQANTPPTYFGGVTMIAALMLLSWPPRRALALAGNDAVPTPKPQGDAAPVTDTAKGA